MKKTILIILGLLALIVIGVALAGMYKFNYLASQPGYDVDGNKVTEEMNKENTVITMNVAPQKVECVGVGPMECMVVNGEFFYDQIEGFEHEEGFEYELQVEKNMRPEPVPADAGIYTYKLVEIVSKTEVKAETPLLRYSPEGTNWNYNGGTVSFENGRYMADFGCNNISGEFTSEKTKLTFGPAISTRKGCPENIAQKEQEFGELITQMNTYSETEDGSQLNNGADLIMELQTSSAN